MDLLGRAEATGKQVWEMVQLEKLEEEPVPSECHYLLFETQSSSSSSLSGTSERRQVG